MKKKINENMTGKVIKETSTHILVELETGSKFVYKKSSLWKK